jgi:hypothetical protein
MQFVLKMVKIDQEAFLKFSDYSALEQDLNADTLYTAECMQSWRWTRRRVIAYWRSYFQTMQFVLESKMDTSESYCVLEVVLQTKAIWSSNRYCVLEVVFSNILT